MCYICHSGYIPAVDGTCELTKADGCPPGEFKDGTTCKECEEGCLACTSNPGNCQGCKLGYRANSGKCTSCIANCNVCFSATSCNTCKAGYYLVGSRCLECNEDSGDQSSCRSCAMSNYYYGSFNSGTCSASTDKNCYQYDDETGCHTCLDGFAKREERKWIGLLLSMSKLLRDLQIWKPRNNLHRVYWRISRFRWPLFLWKQFWWISFRGTRNHTELLNSHLT